MTYFCHVTYSKHVEHINITVYMTYFCHATYYKYIKYIL